MNNTSGIISKVWSFCNTLRDDAICLFMKIEETITNSLQQAEALRQSILKKAFEGKLI